jgi:hypothetical protein
MENKTTTKEGFFLDARRGTVNDVFTKNNTMLPFSNSKNTTIKRSSFVFRLLGLFVCRQYSARAPSSSSFYRLLSEQQGQQTKGQPVFKRQRQQQ